MSSPSVKLYRLRGIFVVYFVLKSIVGTVVAYSILQPIAGRYDLRGWSSGSMAFFSLTVAAVILVLAWLVFAQLLLRKNWARVLLLVLGWLAVISAFFSLLMSAQFADMNSWLGRLVPGLHMDWRKLLAYDRVQKVFELLFWGYLISVLQFDSQVRDEFFPQAPVEKTPE
jgi:hypothetical protein